MKTTVTFTLRNRIVDGKRVKCKPRTITATWMWVSPQYAYAAGWRLYGERLGRAHG